MVIAILQALVALPKIGELVAGMIQQIVVWYLQKQQGDTLAAIADAAATAARATNEAERFAAAQKWVDALARGKISA